MRSSSFVPSCNVLACAALGFAAAIPAARGSSVDPPAAIPAASGQEGRGERTRQVHQVGRGPWGDLEFYYTYLEAPEALLDLVPVPSQQTVWRFPGASPEEIRTLFASCGLEPDLTLELESRSVWHLGDDGVRVHPTRRVVEQLPPEARLKIYRVLRNFPENPYHRQPVIIENGDPEEWFRGTGVGPGAIAAIAALSYPLGSGLAFSDLPYLLGMVSTEEEEREILKASTRTRSMILRLRLSEDSDFAALASYWTAGFKHKDILPLLESVQRAPGVERVDIAHLLPPLPRKLLYTFPPRTLGVSGRYPDNFWTSLNFFEFSPGERFHDAAEVEAEIREKYARVPLPYRFGDLLLFLEPGSRTVVHSAIYLADDIVYVKNGPSLLKPWLLMRLPDVVTRVPSERPPVIEGWRRKDAVVPSRP